MIEIRTPPDTTGRYRRDINGINEYCHTLRRKLRQNNEDAEREINNLKTLITVLSEEIAKIKESIATLEERIDELSESE